ncbi:hypothetical protein N7447_002300 [Penicillium robsamsonii]|uniref:uncharacterized protein n=1 Tax=Penicillium robsamsonii TaxID=1792511 RepID=UPI0025479C73|nr:uncharacterized protein N7447_002300 [Penicillium robsamsonii]KAJ5836274.1 hypothetical protein N7447_002300 [Penicillium robsamsonii]
MARPLWGPGSVGGKDWTSVEDADQTTLGGDQGEGLPEIGSFVLYKIEPPLKEKEDFDTWLDTVTKILQGHNLHRLINKEVEKPDRDSENAEKWMKISMQVRAWLRAGLDPEIAKDITSTGERTTWADDFMQVCKKQLRGEGHGALSAAIIRFVRTKREEFSTTTEFIQAMKTRFVTANDLKASFCAYHAIVLMVAQLYEIPELRGSIEIKNNELKSIVDPAMTLTTNDFFKYCQEMIDKIKEIRLDEGLAASGTNRNRQAKSDKKDRLMNAPLKGKSIKDHIKEWRNHKVQRSTNGACSYCGTNGHDAKDCYHLVREDRPASWKPKPGLWYYKTYQEFKEDKSQQFTGKPSERTKQANFDAVATSATAKDDDIYDFSGAAIAREGVALSGLASNTRQLRSGIDWVLDSGSSWHICTNKDLFVTYTPYKPGTATGWDSSNGQSATAEGHGDIILPIRKPSGGRFELRIHCEYKPGNRFNLLGLIKAKKDLGITWNIENMTK